VPVNLFEFILTAVVYSAAKQLTYLVRDFSYKSTHICLATS